MTFPNPVIQGSTYELDRLPRNYPIQVARGRISGAQPFGAYGRIKTSGASSGLLWPDGTYTFPAEAGITMSIVSTSDQDKAGGTGMHSVDVHYLTPELEEEVVTVALNGTTPVPIPVAAIRFVQCMHRISGSKAAGEIYAYNGANKYADISTGKLRCSSSLRMVPKGKKLIVTSMYAGIVSGTAAANGVVELATPSFEGHDFTADSLFMPMFAAAFQDASSGLTIPCPLAFTEGQSIGMTYEVDKSATIVGSWFGWLEPI